MKKSPAGKSDFRHCLSAPATTLLVCPDQLMKTRLLIVYSAAISAEMMPDSVPVSHDDVLPLAGDPETSLLQSTDCIEVIHAGQFGHDSHLDFARHFISAQFRNNLQILRYGIGNVLQGFLFRGPL